MPSLFFRRWKSNSVASSLPRVSAAAVAHTKPSQLQITRLDNGIRVASEDAPGHFVGVGVYVDAGSRYEPTHLRGLSHFTDRMAYKSSQSRSREAMTAAIERLGGNVMCASSRENILYQANIFRHHIDDILSLYADTIRYPLLTADEIAETKSIIEYELGENYAKPEFIVPEILHQTAFQSNTLGLPQICQPGSVGNVLREHVDEYRSVFYRPENLVIAGVGMEHPYLVELAQKYFGDMASPSASMAAKAPIRETARYTGGLRVQAHKDLEFTQMALGFPGVSFDDEDIYAVSTLQVMLGGGNSFSAGGPGKGMYSRLFTNVLNRFHWVETVVASHTCYRDAGLFSIQMAAPQQALNAVLDIVGYEIRRVLEKPINDVELERAKNQLRSSLFMNLESKLVQLEDIGRQVQMRGKRICPREMSVKIDAVTASDLKKVMRKMVAQEPTLVVLGDVEQVPDVSSFQRKFGLGKYLR
jgi:processing peptidase subunit alpha